MPPDYVLDHMEMYEAKALLKYEYYAHKDDWEQARLVAFIMAQCNVKKKLTYDDIVKFYWEDEKDKEEQDTSITKEDIERLRNKSQQLLATWQKLQST